MNKLLICFYLLLALSFALPAQFSYAAFSPKAKTVQQVGYTTVTIEYDRPMARGRKIFGGLIPYDEMWHTGASGTTITFDRPVRVADHEVPAGSYALQVFPRKDEWTFVLSTAKDGIGHYKAEYDVVNVCVPVKKPGYFYEAFSVALDLTPGNAQLYVSWTDVQVSVPITTDAETRAMAFIDSLAAAPLTDDLEEYYRAANYLRFNRRSWDKVALFGEQIVTLDKNRYWPYEMLADAYQGLGQKAKALAALKAALAILPVEFPGQTEAINTITTRLEKQRREIEALQ